ncbi:hypothetical protein [Hyphomonas sp.]|uniref:hypothetical protein n=1 Tax=Hyphomonas sp. TaxID=87 RepID=UPI0025C43CD4|nr:hypothetical protein [Hyphomonas sp.]
MAIDENLLKAFNDRLNAMSEDEVKSLESEQVKRSDDEFKEFKAALSEDNCSLCGRAIKDFVQSEPCLHWLIKSRGFRARYFQSLADVNGFRSMNSYLRWVANTEAFAKNINDLVAEKQSEKFIEETISYKNLEWSFSCSNSDRQGHAGSHYGSMPHFHFQMKVDGNVTISYNAFHISFTDEDELFFAVESGKIDRLKPGRRYDAGMQALLDLALENPDFIESLQYTEDESEAMFSTDILIYADQGSVISGDDIADLLERRNKTKESMASLAKELPNVSVQTIVSPSDNIPDIARRSGGRRKKK